jgi:hypothetical protein
VIDNNGPPAPRSLTASAVGAGSNVVNLAWSDPVNPPAPVTGAFAQLCQASCAAAVALSAGGAGQITALAPGSYTVRLWLVDSAGKGGPQNAATAAVSVPTAPPGGGKGGGKGTHAKRLRLRARLHGARLTVTALVPTGERGRVGLHLDIVRGNRLLLIARRKVRVRHGVAREVFTLSSETRRVGALVVEASASGVVGGRLTVELRRRG